MEGNEDAKEKPKPVEELVKQDEIIISKDNISKEILWRDGKAIYVWLEDGQVKEEPYCWFCPLCDYAVEPESVFRGMLCPGCNRRAAFRPRGKPIPLDDLKAGVVRAPTNVSRLDSIDQLIRDTRDYIHRWVDVPEKYEQIAAYYIMFTYCFDWLQCDLPYLRVLGGPGVGKTRFLGVVGDICYRAISLGSTSPASVRRVLNDWHGTLVLNEGDFHFSAEWSDIAKVLNNGNTPKQPILVCDQNDATKRHYFAVYGPKVISTRKAFYDDAIESRCITISMEKTERRDIRRNLPPAFYRESEELRSRWLSWRLQKKATIIDYEHYENLVSCWHVEPRIQQILMPLAWVMHDDSDALLELEQLANELNEEWMARRVESKEGLVAECIHALYQEGAVEIKSSDVAGWLSANRHVELNSRQIGRVLTSLKIPLKHGRARVRSLTPPLIARLEKRFGLGANDDETTSNDLFATSQKSKNEPSGCDMTTSTASHIGTEGRNNIPNIKGYRIMKKRLYIRIMNEGPLLIGNAANAATPQNLPSGSLKKSKKLMSLGSLRSLDEITEDYVLRLIGVEQKHHGVSKIPAMLIANRVWNFLRENGCDVEHFPVWQRVEGICERSPLIGLSSETSGDEDCWVRSDGVRPEWDSEKRNDEE